MGTMRFLYEVIPDLFPYGFLSEVEVRLWGKFFENEKNKNKG